LRDVSPSDNPTPFAGLTKDEMACIREMKPDVIKMAKDADAMNTWVGGCSWTFFYLNF
jgi:hypothetical protein